LLQNVYGRHHNLTDRYEISISQMTMDLLLCIYMFSFLYHCYDFYWTWLYIYELHDGRIIRSINCLPFASTGVNPRFFLCFLLCCPIMYVSLRSEFRVMKSVTISALCLFRLYFQLFVGGLMSCLRYLCIVMSYTYCVVFSSSCVPSFSGLSICDWPVCVL
jgi:hypothetical protein